MTRQQRTVFGEVADTYDSVRATYPDALIDDVIARPDFPEISAKRLGVYPQMTGEQAAATLKLGTDVPPEPKAFVKNWLKERYGVSLK